MQLPRRRRYWVLLADPSHYRIDDAVRELDIDTWTASAGDLAIGDRAAIWRTQGADAQRGIVALAEVVAPPEERRALQQ